ncbi:MAG: HAD-IC family P-type ATPase [Aggregatilineales bacterium]
MVTHAKAQNLALVQPENFEAISGRGLQATVDNQQILIGSPRFIIEQQIDITVLSADIERLQNNARTVIVVAVNGQVAGVMGIADKIKNSSAGAITQLQSLNLQVAMLTGDNQQTAQAIANETGIKQVYAEVLPGEKADTVKSLQNDKTYIAMVGDGINDAPALAQADVGIAIGTGTDVAIEASDVTLMRGDLDSVAAAISLSKATMRTIRQNLFWAFIYNLILLPVAILGGLIPMMAAGAMAFSSVFVVSNSLRLRHSRSVSTNLLDTATLPPEDRGSKLTV